MISVKKCGVVQGHVLGVYDISDYDRFIFDKNLFISENTITKKRLEKYLKGLKYF